MGDPLVYYSCNCYLAWLIAHEYYDDVHWVWVSPFFGSSTGSLLPPSAPSSTPAGIARRLKEDLRGHDGHSPSIDRLRSVGLPNGASAKHTQGLIDDSQRKEIEAIIERAPDTFFRPLIYVIPTTPSIDDLLIRVDVDDRANPAVPEYRIEELPGTAFNVLELDELWPT